MRELLLCADDYAQNEDITAGILSLIQQDRINAVSCLVNSQSFAEYSQDLKPLKNKVFVGLHLNLTFGQPLSAKWRKHEGERFQGLPRLLKRAYLRQLDLDVVLAELKAQIDVFTHAMHVYPDFIDGHEHIHQLPIVRKALLELYQQQHNMAFDEENIPEHKSFIRQTSNGLKDLFSLTSFPKRQLISLLGGMKFKRLLIREAIPTNVSFNGIYNIKCASQYRKYFQKFLNNSKNGGLIMCHPGNRSNDKEDPLYLYRHSELEYFLSDAFLRDLLDNSVKLMSRGC